MHPVSATDQFLSRDRAAAVVACPDDRSRSARWATALTRLSRTGSRPDPLPAAADVLVAHLSGAPHSEARALVEAARDEARWLGGEDSALVASSFCAGALVALLSQGKLSCAALPGIADGLRRIEGADFMTTAGLLALQDPRLTLLPLEDCLDATMALLTTLGPATKPSVWVPGDGSDLRLLRWLGNAPHAEDRDIAQALLTADDDRCRADDRMAFVVRRFQRPCAALTFRLEDAGAAGHASALATVTTRLLSRSFERASLFATSANRTATLVRASERRVTRLGFDLHDGPLQEIAIVRGEICKLQRMLADEPSRPRLTEHVDGLAAAVEHLDADLRDVALSLNGSSELRRPFDLVLGDVIRVFAARTGVTPSLSVTGDIGSVSDSQRIALLRVVQECLSNVREHSKARKVSVTVTVGATQVDAMIEDDGAGFDVEETLRRSARHGRMGLLGINERIRLLGGFCDIDSQPGAGCCVSLTIARWTPEMAALATQDAADPR
jgi:signal transduction histidine kinase